MIWNPVSLSTELLQSELPSGEIFEPREGLIPVWRIIFLGPPLLDRPAVTVRSGRAHVVIWRYDLREKGRGSDVGPRVARR